MEANKFMKFPGNLLLFIRGCRRRLQRIILKPLFKSCGKDVSFDPADTFSYSNISIGDHVYIGSGAVFTSIKDIVIGNKVMFGPRVTIIGGDHNTGELGQYMYDVKNKLPENDQPVIIDDDVWGGCNVTILKGVHIHTGAIVAAGALVTRTVPEYAIAAGVPAKVVKMRWAPEDLAKHKSMLKPIK